MHASAYGYGGGKTFLGPEMSSSRGLSTEGLTEFLWKRISVPQHYLPYT